MQTEEVFVDKFGENFLILLKIKTFDLRKNPAKPKEFSRAQYRIINEDT